MIVIDASVAAGAFFPSQLIAGALEAVTAARGSIVAPTILYQEFVNAGYRLERRTAISSAALDRAIRAFDALQIEFIWDDEFVRRALEIARAHRQTQIFDAIYLACAEDLGFDLWTCDRRFVQSFGRERSALLKLCPDDLL